MANKKEVDEKKNATRYILDSGRFSKHSMFRSKRMTKIFILLRDLTQNVAYILTFSLISDYMTQDGNILDLNQPYT